MINLRPGDIFCTENPMMLGRAINAIQAVWDPEGQANYSHAGIVCSADGETSEALWTIRRSHLDIYRGKPVIIGRHEAMTLKLFREAYGAIECQEGAWYPIWRLPLHLIPPLAKYLHFSGLPVCSEWAAKFLHEAGIFKKWAGKTPDYLADTIRLSRHWTVVFEGVWE